MTNTPQDPRVEILKEAQRRLTRASSIIEIGDVRLMASDGDAGGQPPDISLKEWRELYECLEEARDLLSRLDAVGEPVAYMWRCSVNDGPWDDWKLDFYLPGWVSEDGVEYEAVPLYRRQGGEDG